MSNYGPPLPLHRSEMESTKPAAVTGEVFYSPPGTVIRRPGIGQVLGVR